MADFQKMYAKLFSAVTEAVDLLKAAQREAEKLYMSSYEANKDKETERDNIYPGGSA